jgi:hypothetical protein
MKESPDGKWHCRFEKNRISVSVTVRIGIDLWNYIAGHELAFMEICTSLLRACVKPSEGETGKYMYKISDLEEIISLAGLANTFNTKILQRSQLEWLFFFAWHFCDQIVPGHLAALPVPKELRVRRVITARQI